MVLRHTAQHLRRAVEVFRTLKVDHPDLRDIVHQHDCRASLLEQQSARPPPVGAAFAGFTAERWQIDVLVRNLVNVTVL